jgi:hypothetical protein
MKLINQTKASISRAGLKHEVRRLLADRNLELIEEHFMKTPRVFSLCTGLLYDAEPLICLRATEALGRLSVLLARKDIEALRVNLRKLFWSMNDESGSVGWYAAPAIAEIIVNVPELERDFFPPLVSLLHTEPFERAVHQAVARVLCRVTVKSDWPVARLLESLELADSYLVASALIGLDGVQSLDEITVQRYLNNDDTTLRFYDFKTGIFYSTTLPDLARSILAKRKEGDK